MAALDLKQPDRVPFMDYVDTAVKIQIMGTDDIDEAELARKIGMDAIYFVDYAMPVFCKSHSPKSEAPKAYGLTGETEFIGEGLIRTEADLSKIVLPDPREESFYDPAKRFMEKYHDQDLAIYAGLRPFGMFTTIYSMPMMDFAVALHENIKLINTMMDIFIEWNLVVLEKLQTLGIDFLVTYNDMAWKGGPMVSPQAFREVFLPKRLSGFPVFLCPRPPPPLNPGLNSNPNQEQRKEKNGVRCHRRYQVRTRSRRRNNDDVTVQQKSDSRQNQSQAPWQQIPERFPQGNKKTCPGNQRVEVRCGVCQVKRSADHRDPQERCIKPKREVGSNDPHDDSGSQVSRVTMR